MPSQLDFSDADQFGLTVSDRAPANARKADFSDAQKFGLTVSDKGPTPETADFSDAGQFGLKIEDAPKPQAQQPEPSVPVLVGNNPDGFGPIGQVVNVTPQDVREIAPGMLGSIASAPYFGTQQLIHGVQQIGQGDVLRGAGNAFVGSAKTLTGPGLGLAAMAPIDAAAWWMLSYGAGGTATELGKRAGMKPEDANELGEVVSTAPMLYGGIETGLRKLGEARGAMREQVAQQWEARGQKIDDAIELGAEPGEAAPITVPLKNGRVAEIQFAGRDPKGRGYFWLVDKETGAPLQAPAPASDLTPILARDAADPSFLDRWNQGLKDSGLGEDGPIPSDPTAKKNLVRTEQILRDRAAARRAKATQSAEEAAAVPPIEAEPIQPEPDTTQPSSPDEPGSGPQFSIDPTNGAVTPPTFSKPSDFAKPGVFHPGDANGTDAGQGGQIDQTQPGIDKEYIKVDAAEPPAVENSTPDFSDAADHGLTVTDNPDTAKPDVSESSSEPKLIGYAPTTSLHGTDLKRTIQSEAGKDTFPVYEIPIDQIRSLDDKINGYVRSKKADIDRYADLIRQDGGASLPPLVGERDTENGGYVVSNGTRRLYAARQAGLATVPVAVRKEASDKNDNAKPAESESSTAGAREDEHTRTDAGQGGQIDQNPDVAHVRNTADETPAPYTGPDRRKGARATELAPQEAKTTREDEDRALAAHLEGKTPLTIDDLTEQFENDRKEAEEAAADFARFDRISKDNAQPMANRALAEMGAKDARTKLENLLDPDYQYPNGKAGEMLRDRLADQYGLDWLPAPDKDNTSSAEASTIESDESRPSNPEALEDAPAESGAGATEGGTTRPGGKRSGGTTRGDVRSSEGEGTRTRPGGRTGAGSVDETGQRPGDGRGNPERVLAQQDFRITDEHAIGEGTERQKLNQNLEAIRIVKALAVENRTATPAEQAKLAKYVGWGGLDSIFDTWKTEWAGAREDLKSLLTDEEYAAARASTTNAHYTSPLVVSAMWDTMRHLGLKPNVSVLEPSMGVGTFFGLQPDDLLPARRTGVELDSITGQIAKALYPNSNVQISGFQDLALPNDFYDVAIGNVPFGNVGVHDPKYKKIPFATRSIHNYFFVKSLDLVRPGGIVAYVTSRYTMDAKTKTLRQLLAQKADLIGMFRLPDTAFKGNAGTSVVTDVILLQKRAPGAERGNMRWLDTVQLPIEGGTTKINQYYADHPDHVLGKLDMSGKMYTNDPDADRQNVTGQLTPEILQKAIASLPEGIFKQWEASTPTFQGEDIVQLGDPVKDGGYDIRDGIVVQRDGSLYRPVSLGKTQELRVRGMIPVRQALREVYRTQIANESEAQILKARKELNQVYDGFVKKFGPISSAANSRAMGADPDYLALSALEKNFDKETNTAEKMPIFSERTIETPKPAEKADTAAEALAITLNERGRVDWTRMQELTGKTPAELRSDLKGILFKNPDGQKWETAEEYLSGRVRDKLAAAEAAAATDPAYETNLEALQKVQPEDLTTADIKVVLGAGWIDPNYVQDFLAEELDIDDVKVTYSPIVGSWNVTDTKLAKRVKNVEAGTGYFSGLELVEKALNGKRPRVTDRDGRVIKDATVAAQAALEALKDRFREWLWTDHNRAAALTKHYNWELNNLRGTEYDGSHLTLPGSNPAITLRPHQKNAIWRIIRKGSALLAHEVGAGKTWEMVGAAMELRRLGLARKPMLVIPNHMLEQVTTEFYQLYPAARILTIGRDELSQDKRKRAMARIANGVWDAVIVAHSSFGKIPVSDATFEKFVNEQLAELRAALEEAKANAKSKKDRDGDRSVKEIEKAIERLEVKLHNRLNRESKDDGVTFEELGVDALFVDEAHAYKKLPIATQRTRVAGIPTGDSQRASDMFMKTHYLMGLNGAERGVVFATGTPVTNTMAEMYTMQKYLQPQALKDAGVYNFDAWANAFGEIQAGYELDVSGKGFRENERFSKFINIPELLRMFQQVADIKTAEQLKLPRPDLVTDAMQPITGAASPELKRFINYLVKRTEDIRNRVVDVDEDNMLKVVSEGKKAALDIRLVMPNAPDYTDSKVNKAVANILKFWKEGKAEKTTQLVFCDLSVPLSAKRKTTKKATPKPAEEGEGDEQRNDAVPEGLGEASGFSVYDDMKAKLIRAGIPEKEIAFIHDYNGDAAKQQLFDDMNAGRVRVLFGSTEKLGVGTNVQKRMIALHHMDTPWRPGDVTQRNGRIQRQGNMHKRVHIFQYLTEGSFDAYSWQLVENKARFIAAVMTGDLSLREMDDIGMMIPNADEFKALATGDPMVKEKIMVDGQLGKLEAQRSAFWTKRMNAQWNYASMPGRIQFSKTQIRYQEHDLKILNQNEGWTVGGQKFSKDEREEAAKAIWAAMDARRGDVEPETIGAYRGIPLRIWQYHDTKGNFSGDENTFPNLSFEGQALTDTIKEDAKDPMGVIRSMEAIARYFLRGDELKRLQGQLSEEEKRYSELAGTLDQKWPMEAKYHELIRRKAELDAHFAGNRQPAITVAQPETDEDEPFVDRSEGEVSADHGSGPRQVRRSEGERGSIDPDFLTLGLSSYVADHLHPKAKEVAALLRETADDIQRIVAPASRSEDAHNLALSVRANAANLARSTDRVNAALKTARTFLESLPLSERWMFVSAVEHGMFREDADSVPMIRKDIGEDENDPEGTTLQQTPNEYYAAHPEMYAMAKAFRQILDSRRDAIQKLGTGKLQSVIEDYFPHIWKRNDRYNAIFGGRRPLEGRKSFLKRRKIATIADGLRLGLEPVSDNPVDLVMAKAHEMDKYLTAHRILQDAKKLGLTKWKRATEPMPEGYAAVNDSVTKRWSEPTHPGALQFEGEWTLPEPAAQVLNNYLSPGLRDRSAAFRSIQGLSNLINQAQLGWSAFHGAFTTFDVMVSKLSLGFYQMAHGDLLLGLKSIAQIPLAPIANPLRGHKMLAEWDNPGTMGPKIGALVDAAMAAGGRAHMDSFYATKVTENMMLAFKSLNPWRMLIGGVGRLPFALTEQAARPIMEYLVPRQKMGVFADMAEYELERLGFFDAPEMEAAKPNKTKRRKKPKPAPLLLEGEIMKALAKVMPGVVSGLRRAAFEAEAEAELAKLGKLPPLAFEAYRDALARAWDSVDNRLGQLVYDNLFWHKVTKDLAMVSVRSVGWNVGTIREVGGAAPDTAKFLTGKGDFTHRMGYLIALQLLVLLAGAIATYLMTGHGPRKFADYAFPPDANGRRWALPTYEKDMYHWGTDPVNTAKGKVNPLISLTWELLSNRDFFGHPIAKHADLKGLEAYAEHVAKVFEPMSWRATDRAGHKVPAADHVRSAFGITPAPRSLQELGKKTH